MTISTSTATIRSDWKGRVIAGKFPLLQWLGGTESSGVFLTELDGVKGRYATIKLFLVEAGEIPTTAWAATRSLAHPNLVRIFDTGRCAVEGVKLHYVTMEFAGEVLSEIVAERRLLADETRQMIGPILEALSYLHNAGFVHGRLKPSNVVVVDSELKLSTDGLLDTRENGGHFEELGVRDAPELADGLITPAADVWSFGALLVEALTQQLPVWDGSPSTEPIVPKSMPQPFANIARDCLRLNPARRLTLNDIYACLEPAAGRPDMAWEVLLPGIPGQPLGPIPAQQVAMPPSTREPDPHAQETLETDSIVEELGPTPLDASELEAPPPTSGTISRFRLGEELEPRGFRWPLAAGIVALIVLAVIVGFVVRSRAANERAESANRVQTNAARPTAPVSPAESSPPAVSSASGTSGNTSSASPTSTAAPSSPAPVAAAPDSGAALPATVPTTATPLSRAQADATLPARSSEARSSEATADLPVEGPVVKGEAIERPVPTLAPNAIKTIHGTVRVQIRVRVDPNGDPAGVSYESRAPSQYFSRIALEAAQHWRFKPAQVDGKDAPSSWVLHFIFRRTGADVVPVEVSP